MLQLGRDTAGQLGRDTADDRRLTLTPGSLAAMAKPTPPRARVIAARQGDSRTPGRQEALDESRPERRWPALKHDASLPAISDPYGLSAQALQQINFVIVAQPRSGSYHLCSLLDSASDVICHGEVFKKEKIEISPWHARRLGVGKSLANLAKTSLGIRDSRMEMRDADPLDFLLRLRSLDPDKAFGFKAFPTHLIQREDLHSNVLMSPHWRKVFLLRNPLERYASLLRAEATKIWALQSDGRVSHGASHGTKLETRVVFEKDSFEKHMENHKWFRRLRDSAMEPNPDICFDILYEQLNDSQKIAELLSFICSSNAPDRLSSRYRKQSNIPFAQGFANWEEFEIYLREAGLSHHMPPHMPPP